MARKYHERGGFCLQCVCVAVTPAFRVLRGTRSLCHDARLDRTTTLRGRHKNRIELHWRTRAPGPLETWRVSTAQAGARSSCSMQHLQKMRVHSAGDVMGARRRNVNLHQPYNTPYCRQRRSRRRACARKDAPSPLHGHVFRLGSGRRLTQSLMRVGNVAMCQHPLDCGYPCLIATVCRVDGVSDTALWALRDTMCLDVDTRVVR